MFYNPAPVAGNGGISFVDKGDPGDSWDFQVGDITKDGTWYDLDLSGILGAGATWVLLRVEVGGTLDNIFFFRKNGYTGEIGQAGLYADGTSTVSALIWVACDANRIIEYKAAAALTSANIEVIGWIV